MVTKEELLKVYKDGLEDVNPSYTILNTDLYSHLLPLLQLLLDENERLRDDLDYKIDYEIEKVHDSIARLYRGSDD